jgi:uncharacterized cupredoxin-like copper-binding protein
LLTLRWTVGFFPRVVRYSQGRQDLHPVREASMNKTTLIALSVVSSMLVVSLLAWASAPPTRVVRVMLTDYDVKFSPSTWKAGTVTLVGTNDGHGVVHEIRLVKTDLPADKLPLEHDGRVNEDSARLTTIAAVEDLDPGESGAVTVKLEPGRYVYFCNEHNHYLVGMRGELTVAP